MKLTQKAVAALKLPTGKTDVIHFDDEIAGLRLSAAQRCWRQGHCAHGSANIAMAGHPSAAAWFGRGARCRAGARPWPRRRWAVSPTARTRRPASSTGAARTDIRSRPPSPITWRSSSARCAHAPTPSWRAISPARYFKPLHSLALDQITRKDVASRLNRITLESSSIVAGRARAR